MENNNDEEEKRNSRKIHPQPPSLATVFEEQEDPPERPFTLLPCIDSESDEELDDEDGEEFEFEAYGDYGYEYFSSRGFDSVSELGFLEDPEDGDIEMGTEEDEIDPDDLSYEQLIELGEFIGAEERGLSLDQISSCLRPVTYKTVDIRTGTDRCVVCQIEYEEGERLAALPCKHPYHSECIGQWLQIKKMCPICSEEVSATPADVAQPI